MYARFSKALASWVPPSAMSYLHSKTTTATTTTTVLSAAMSFAGGRLLGRALPPSGAADSLALTRNSCPVIRSFNHIHDASMTVTKDYHAGSGDSDFRVRRIHFGPGGSSKSTSKFRASQQTQISPSTSQTSVKPSDLKLNEEVYRSWLFLSVLTSQFLARAYS